MLENLNDVLSALEAAASKKGRDIEDVVAAANEAIRGAPQAMTLARATTLLEHLRNKKRLRALVEVGGAIADALDHPRVHRLRAQGMIDQGDLDGAILVLDAILRQIDRRLEELSESTDASAPHERITLRRETAEVRGLLGRAYKQRYVNSDPTPQDPRTADAWQASSWYLSAYRDAPYENIWHGINVVAIRHHQNRRLNPGTNGRDAEADGVANEILRSLAYKEENDRLDVWDLATRAEALLSLERYEEAAAAYTLYAGHPDAEPFMLGSAERQLREVWEADPEDPRVGPLLNALSPREAANTESGDGLESIGTLAEEKDDSSAGAAGPLEDGDEGAIEFGDVLEARFDDPAFTAAHKVHDDVALNRARAVARLGPDPYTGYGSGFLFPARRIWENYDKPLPILMTNAHVCSPDAKAALQPNQARIIFMDRRRGRPANTIIEWVDLIWHSPVDELDASLLLLGAMPGQVDWYPVKAVAPKKGTKASIIGHPLGGVKWYSLEKNGIDEVQQTFFYYTTPTEPGNSGSPVFDAEWNLIGLHRAASQTKPRNYGIRIDKILEAARDDLLAKWPNGPELEA